MRILRARRTARFVYFFVRCRCGSRFGHRAQKPWVVCYQCGRVVEMARVRRPRSRAAMASAALLATTLGDGAGGTRA